MAVTMKNAVFWDVTPVALARTDVSEEILVFLRCVRRLLVTANGVTSTLIPVTLMMEALRSSQTSVLTRATRRNIPEDGILQIIVPFSNLFLKVEKKLLNSRCNTLIDFMRYLSDSLKQRKGVSWTP
jgi:hypothetical protein